LRAKTARSATERGRVSRVTIILRHALRTSRVTGLAIGHRGDAVDPELQV
jgi:hypothetical protein